MSSYPRPVFSLGVGLDCCCTISKHPSWGPPAGAAASGADRPGHGVLRRRHQPRPGGCTRCTRGAGGFCATAVSHPAESIQLSQDTPRLQKRSAATTLHDHSPRFPSTLSMQREWRLIEVDATLEAADAHRNRLLHLLHPAATVRCCFTAFPPLIVDAADTQLFETGQCVSRVCRS